MEDDKLNAARQSKPQLPIGWLILFFALLILMLWMFYGGLGSSSDRTSQEIDRQKCAGLSGPECFAKLDRERRLLEIAESPEGQAMLRAAQVTEN